MGELLLSLEPTAHAASEYGIAAVISRVAGIDGRPVPAQPRTVMIPSVGRLAMQSAPGLYVVEAYLPSGEVQDLQFELAEDATSLDVHVGSALTASFPKAPHPFVLGLGRAFDYPSAGGMSAAVTASLDLDQPETHVEVKAIDAAEPACDWTAVLSSHSDCWRELDGTDGWIEFRRDEDTFRISRDRALQARCWSQVSQFGRTRIASLPFGPFDDRARTVEISNVSSERCTMTLRDSRIGLILNYLAGGYVLAASEVLTRLEAEISHTSGDRGFAAAADAVVGGPMSLCAAAYAASASTSHEGWAEVVEALAAQAWLPDGALLAGHRLLRHGTDEEDWTRAAECLRIAVSRGVPYFSLGMRYLVDGLTLLVDFDPSLKDVLVTVMSVAKRTSRNEAFTVIDT